MAVFGGSLDYDRVSYKRNHYQDLGNEQTGLPEGRIGDAGDIVGAGPEINDLRF